MATTVLVISAGAVQVGDWLLQAEPIRQLEPMRVKHVGRDAGLATVCLLGQADSGERIVVVLASDQVRVERQIDAAQQAERLRSVGARPGGHGELARRLREARS